MGITEVMPALDILGDTIGIPTGTPPLGQAGQVKSITKSIVLLEPITTPG